MLTSVVNFRLNLLPLQPVNSLHFQKCQCLALIRPNLSSDFSPNFHDIFVSGGTSAAKFLVHIRQQLLLR